MFHYDEKKMKILLGQVIRDNVSKDVWKWLEEKRKIEINSVNFNRSFAIIPRKTGKAIIRIRKEQNNQIQSIFTGFSIDGWPVDRLCRVWLLTYLDSSEKENYFRIIENVFLSAEMSELVALYSALSLLAYPELWRKRCEEGIRSNIGPVLEAIMYNNPYPSANLDEPAWNQMILKAIFTDKQVQFITGIDRRANRELAFVLSDYAHERWAANRTLNPQLWRLVGKFIDEKLFPDVKRAFQNDDVTVKKAAALALSQSGYEPAKNLLKEYPNLKSAIENNALTWESLAIPG